MIRQVRVKQKLAGPNLVQRTIEVLFLKGDFLMQLKVTLLGAGVVAGLSLFATGVSAATTYVKVGQTDHNFLKTMRTIKTTDEDKQFKLTIPKGTIVDVTETNWNGDKKGQVHVEINLQRVSYKLRGKHTAFQTDRILATTKTFKKVHVPQYVQYYTTQKIYPKNVSRTRVADGNLYAGLKVPNIYSQPGPTAARLYVTSDGYVEYYKSAPVMNLQKTQVPTTSAKITKVKRVPSKGLTMLYTKTAVPTAIGERVSKTGNQQYLTTIKRRYRSSATVFNRSNAKTAVDSIRLASLYKVKDHDFFMNSDVVFPEY